MTDVPEARSSRERGRVAARGKCTDDGSVSTLLVVHELDGSWTFHGLGAPGVKLSRSATVDLVGSILKRAQQPDVA